MRRSYRFSVRSRDCKDGSPPRSNDSMLTLHHYPSTASMIPHIVLEELGVPYRLQLVDRTRDAHKAPEYLKLNPNGLIPVLQDGGLVLYETAAICLHLADTHPQARLAPPTGTHARAHFYKWLSWLSTTLQPALIAYFYPDRWVDAGNADGAAQVRRHAQARVGALVQQIDAQLASHGGPWLLGADHCAADAYAFTLCRWTRHFQGDAAPPARSLPHVGPYLQRVFDRPAVQRVFGQQQLQAPYF